MLRIILCAVLVFALSTSDLHLALAQEPQPATEQQPPRSGPRDPRELEAFIDGIMAAHKEAHHIAGATVSVVVDGQILFAKGYGYADVANRKKVEPDKTLFRIGSVSKLFTWTAVMQLVEQGKLDLNANVNTYLKDFKIPDTYPQPITMTHLLTHTPGFEDHVIGLFARTPDKLLPLGKILADDMPARVRPPGQLASYSNYGTALAGYIVEQVSGVSWDEYIEKNILQPLEMSHTTGRQPIPENLAADMSKGYNYSGGEYKGKEFEFIPLQPAGSMSAAAIDMARFMIAHLQQGRYGSARILSETTAQQMRRQIFTHAKQLNGILHGFYEMSSNGQRIFGHGGDTLWFHTQLALFPESNVGLFVSYNSDTGAPARNELVKAFIDRYYPAQDQPRPSPSADFKQRASQFEGSYTAIRRSHTTLAKLAALVSVIKISATEDGYLLTTGIGGAPKRWVETEPMVFREIDGQEIMVFRQDDKGQVTHLFLNSFPPIAFAKLATTEAPVFHYSLLGASVLLFLSALIFWPIGAVLNWRKGISQPGMSRLARITAWIVSGLFMVFIVGIAIAFRDPIEIVFGIPPLLRNVLLLPLVAAVLMVGVVLFTLLSWKRGYWRFFGRVHYLLVMLAGLAFLWLLNYWNLLGYRFG